MYRVVESSTLAFLLLREAFSHPNSFYFHLLVNGFYCVSSFHTFSNRWAGRNLNGFFQHTSSYGASKDLILVYTVQLKPMIKAHSSERMASIGISDMVITSVY